MIDLDQVRACEQSTDRKLDVPKYVPGQLRISRDGVFTSKQGEGATAGQEATFIRLNGCNLNCTFCDTGFTKMGRSVATWTPTEAAANVRESWMETYKGSEAQPRVVITGGEPLLQKQEVIELVRNLPGFKVEIETNGTVSPAGLETCQINCSPKLSNSGNPREASYNPAVLQEINGFDNSWFKFVVRDGQDLCEVDAFVEGNQLKNEKVIIMPEGKDAETLKAREKELRDQVEERGWRFSQREHILENYK